MRPCKVWFVLFHGLDGALSMTSGQELREAPPDIVIGRPASESVTEFRQIAMMRWSCHYLDKACSPDFPHSE